MTLTPSQLRVLELTATGQPIKWIAVEMGISPKTVEKHRTLLFAKLGVQNQVRAVVVGFKTGLIKI